MSVLALLDMYTRTAATGRPAFEGAHTEAARLQQRVYHSNHVVEEVCTIDVHHIYSTVP